MGTCERTLLIRRNLSPRILKGLISYEEVICPPSAEPLSHANPEILTLLPLPEEINPLLSAEPVDTFSEGCTRQDNIDVPQGPPIVATTPIARLKSKQAPKVEVES